MAPVKVHRWHVGLILLSITLLILGYLCYHYRGHVRSAFGIITDATGSKTAAVLSIGLAVWVLVCLVFWMILPIVVYFGLRDLQRRAAELNESAQRCVTLLEAGRENEKPRTEAGTKPKTVPAEQPSPSSL